MFHVPTLFSLIMYLILYMKPLGYNFLSEALQLWKELLGYSSVTRTILNLHILLTNITVIHCKVFEVTVGIVASDVVTTIT